MWKRQLYRISRFQSHHHGIEIKDIINRVYNDLNFQSHHHGIEIGNVKNNNVNNITLPIAPSWN